MSHCYSTVSNMRQYGQQLKNQILLFYCIFLSPLPQISLSSSTLSHFFPLYHSLSLPSPPCSRSLSSPRHDLTASLSSPRRWSRQSSPLISPPYSPQLAASCSSPRCLHPQPSLPTFRSLLIGLWMWDLGWVSMWVLGWRLDQRCMGCGLRFWVG